jgi:hypothetical protein
MISRALPAAVCVGLLVCTADGQPSGGGLERATVFAGPSEAAPTRVEEGAIPRPRDRNEFTRIFARLAAEIGRAKTLTIFRGHSRRFDAAKATAEQGRRPSFTRLGQWFFADPLSAPPETVAALRGALLDGIVTPKQPASIKLCGGFHADFLLRWEGPGGTTEAQVCFGCHEVKIVGPGGALYADVAAEQVKALRALLSEPSESAADVSPAAGAGQR